MTDQNDGRAWNFRRNSTVLTEISLQWSVQIFKPPTLSLLLFKSANYFNLRHFSYRSSDRLQRTNAKSTPSIRPQTFAASESVAYPALLCPVVSCPAISCLAFSCPVIWSVIFMSCNFMPCKLVCQFHVRHFHVQHFQPPPPPCYRVCYLPNSLILGTQRQTIKIAISELCLLYIFVQYFLVACTPLSGNWLGIEQCSNRRRKLVLDESCPRFVWHTYQEPAPENNGADLWRRFLEHVSQVKECVVFVCAECVGNEHVVVQWF